VKYDYLVQPFRDRDMAYFLAPFGIRAIGEHAANRRLLETAETFVPDLVIVGHCDTITNKTLTEIRRMLPAVKITACNNDPLFVPENAAKIEQRCAVVDTMFVSTGVRELRRFTGLRAKLAHMPNPVDQAIESHDSSQHDQLEHDLVFCSKSRDYSNREALAADVRVAVGNELNFFTPGNFGVPGVWGRDYDLALANSKMGLNLNRQEGLDWYSSARMAQMGGNGILLFTHASGGFERLFPTESLVYFRSRDDLIDSLRTFNSDNAMRREWAARTRAFFHQQINSTLYARDIVERSLDLQPSHGYVWHEVEHGF
jgi:hypothetical protein